MDWEGRDSEVVPRAGMPFSRPGHSKLVLPRKGDTEDTKAQPTPTAQNTHCRHGPDWFILCEDVLWMWAGERTIGVQKLQL